MADIPANGIRFHVQRLGNGPRTLVFIHGILIDNLSSFYMTLAHALSDRYSFVMYDLRGHGRSEQPPEGYSLQQMILDLRALLAELGLGDERVTLVGNSSGVTIALAYAVRFPEQVDGLVLIDGLINPHEFSRKILETLLAEDGDPHPDAGHIWETWIKQRYVNDELDRDGSQTKELLQRLDSQRRSPLLDAARGLVYRTSFAQDVRLQPPFEEEEIRTIQCPVLALYGGESEMVAEGPRLKEYLPHCRLVLVPEAGHGILRQAAGRLREELKAWLQEREALGG